ncbi:hypothetical protein V5O48_012728 [Marasmius crinis-equi]|uniref:EthD domain-containing protein n=1 Tax=Marasmius crinis-equi TaxID=585013 RepID=A0ABR3F207_9AGAR
MTSTTPAQHAIRTDRVRLLLFVERNPSTTFEEFVKYWREEYAPAFTSTTIAKKNLLRYEQVCRPLSPHKVPHVENSLGLEQMVLDQESKVKMQQLGAKIIECDGVAVLEGESVEKLVQLFSDEEYIEKVAPLADKAFNLKSSRYAFYHPAPIVYTKPASEGKGVRMLAFLKRKEGSTFEEYTRHWIDKHSYLIADFPGFRDVIGLYEQLHLIQDGVLPGSANQEDRWDGVAFLDADSLESFAAKMMDDSFVRVRVEDENRFLEIPESQALPVFVSTLIDS